MGKERKNSWLLAKQLKLTNRSFKKIEKTAKNKIIKIMITRFKKTIFTIFGTALLATGFVACSSDDNANETSSANEMMTTMSVKKGEEVRLGLRVPIEELRYLPTSDNIFVTVDLEDEVIKDIEFSKELLDVIDVTEVELINSFQKFTGGSFFTLDMKTLGESEDPLADNIGHQHNLCVEACNDYYTNPDGSKKKGRGMCKFGCWANTVGEVIKKLEPVLEALK